MRCRQCNHLLIVSKTRAFCPHCHRSMSYYAHPRTGARGKSITPGNPLLRGVA